MSLNFYRVIKDKKWVKGGILDAVVTFFVGLQEGHPACKNLGVDLLVVMI